MPDIEWKDTTSYAQGERGNVEPQTWTATLGGIRIVVTRHVYDKNRWWLFSRSHDLNIAHQDLGTDLDEAKDKAIEIARDIANKKLARLQAFIDGTWKRSANPGVGATMKDAYQGTVRTGTVVEDLDTHWRVDWGPNQTKIRKDRVGRKPKKQGPWWA